MDVPFARMSDAELNRLASVEAFDVLDAQFRGSAGFRKILAKDTRLARYERGEIIIREGDWGNTAFFIVSGSVLVVLEPPESGLPDDLLGRRKSQRKGLFGAVAQLWSNHRTIEYRDAQAYREMEGIGRRGYGDATRVFLRDMPMVIDKYRTTEMHAGQLFGELAALGRTARTATVIANGDIELLEMRWQGLRDLMRKDPSFRNMIDTAFRERALQEYLRKSPLFEHLGYDESAISELANGAQLKTYGEYDRVGSFSELVTDGDETLIAKEGDYPNAVILIRNGLARVSRRYHNGHLTLSYLGPGQVYGFHEIARGHHTQNPLPLESSLRSIGFLTTIEIPTPLVEKHILSRYETGAVHSADGRATSVESSPHFDTSHIPQEFVEFLVEKRFVNGRETMLIDLNRCTRCDDCVRACASAHDNNPRFVRTGPIDNGIMVANACMHCQDPVCMIECPTGAISRRMDDAVVVINDMTCIGCSTCANNCPYDAIRMVEVREKAGFFIRDAVTRTPVPKATKCDLCVDQRGGPACQRACPHDALIRIDICDVAKLTNWQSR